jgi:hypothetical protein
MEGTPDLADTEILFGAVQSIRQATTSRRNGDVTNPETSLNETTQAELNSGGIVGGLMLWVALRCTVQYVLLPFVLPLVGLSAAVSLWLSAAISLFALGLMLFNLQRLWRTSWRWRYLALSLVAGSAIVLFLYLDLTELFGA